MPKPLKLTQHDNAPARQDPEGRHPDLLTASEAVVYLRLDQACPTLAAAHALLDRLCQRGELAGIMWGQKRLYGRAQLDGLLARAIEDAEERRLRPI